MPMRSPKQIGYKVFCALMTAVTAYFLCGRELAEAAESNRRAALSAAQAAANLGIDAEQITNPDAWLAKQKANAERKRQNALQQMRRFTHADEQEARTRSAKGEARRVTQHEGEKVRHELAKGTALRVPEEKLKGQLVKMSPSLDQAIRKNAARPRATASDSKLKGVGDHLKPPQFAPPAPRAAGMHGRLSEPMKEFYASVLGQDASVLLSDGSVVSVEEQLFGIKLPEVKLASIASDLGLPLPLMGALPAPTADDLAQTPETIQTPAITQLAASLNRQPLALYNYVHTKVATELYYGSKKGANATLLAGAGNDFDQAALLIALLRASNFPARYEYGSVRLTLAQATSLTGAPDATTAAYLFAKSGIPAGVGADGQTVLVERAWVRAYVGYGEYRGVGPGGEKIWVRLDPALKRINHTQAVNLRGLVHFDFDAYLSSVTQSTPKEIYEAQLLAAAQSKNLCNSLDAALDKATVVEDSFRLL